MQCGQFNEVVKGRDFLSGGEGSREEVPVLQRVLPPPLSRLPVDLLDEARIELDLVVRPTVSLTDLLKRGLALEQEIGRSNLRGILIQAMLECLNGEANVNK